MNESYETAVQLDIDDIDGYGPETITILEPANGIYRFFVQDYDNAGLMDSTVLSASDARVEIFTESGSQVFGVPTNQVRTLWNVFEMDGSTILQSTPWITVSPRTLNESIR